MIIPTYRPLRWYTNLSSPFLPSSTSSSLPGNRSGSVRRNSSAFARTIFLALSVHTKVPRKMRFAESLIEIRKVDPRSLRSERIERVVLDEDIVGR